jgi:hypothetical protein
VQIFICVLIEETSYVCRINTKREKFFDINQAKEIVLYKKHRRRMDYKNKRDSFPILNSKSIMLRLGRNPNFCSKT